MDRLSSRFSIGNHLARLSSNWGLPDALARLGLADPSAPLHPGSHLGPPHPSPIAEEGSVGQEAGQAAGDSLQAGREQQQQEQQLQQQQQQQMRQPRKALEPNQSAVDGQRLQRRPAQQHNQLAASSQAKLLSGSVLLEQGADNVNGNGNIDAATTRQTAANDGHGNGDGDVSTAKQTAADHTRLEAPGSSSPPAGRAALASLGNAQSSPFQGELQPPAQ